MRTQLELDTMSLLDFVEISYDALGPVWTVIRGDVCLTRDIADICEQIRCDYGDLETWGVHMDGEHGPEWVIDWTIDTLADLAEADSVFPWRQR